VGVIEPDLLSGMERIVGDTHDDGGLPIREARQVAWIGGDDPRHVDVGSGEDIDALVAMTASHPITPQETDEAIRGEAERSGMTLGSGAHFPVRVGSRVLDPLSEFAEALGIWPVIGIEEISECREDSHPKDRCKQKASIHSCIVSRFLSRDQKFTNCLKLPPKSCMMKKSLLVWIKSSDSHFNGNEESILLIFLLDYRIMKVWGGGVCHTNLGRPKNRLSLRLYLFNRKEVVIPK